MIAALTANHLIMQAVEAMIADALCLADPYLRFTETVNDPATYWKVGLQDDLKTHNNETLPKTGPRSLELHLSKTLPAKSCTRLLLCL